MSGRTLLLASARPLQVQAAAEAARRTAPHHTIEILCPGNTAERYRDASWIIRSLDCDRFSTSLAEGFVRPDAGDLVIAVIPNPSGYGCSDLLNFLEGLNADRRIFTHDGRLIPWTFFWRMRRRLASWWMR